MRNLTNWYLSIKDTVLVHIGGFAVGLTIVYILFLMDIDVLGIVESCKYAITDNRRWLCETIRSKNFTVVVGFMLLIFWAIFILIFKKHNARYKNQIR